MTAITTLLANENLSSKMDESISLIRFIDVDYNEESHKQITEFASAIASTKDISARNEYGTDIELLSSFNPSNEGLATIRIIKSGIPFFLSEKSFEDFLDKNISLINYPLLRLFFIDKPFYSLNISFLPFNIDVLSEERTYQETNPVKLVRTLNIQAQQYIPTAVEDWITKEEYLSFSPPSWKYLSTKRLFVTLGSEILASETHLTIDFKGDRRRSVKLALDEKETFQFLFTEVHRIGDWIYYQNRDIESRHTLINQHLSLLLTDDFLDYSSKELKQKLASAYDNSLLSYKYYLSSASKELQKNLTDLDKSLFEYVSKIRQSTIDMGASLWRDFAIVLGVMVLNFGVKKSEILSQYFTIISWGLIAYVGISFFIASSSAFWFYYGIRKSLKISKNKLYSYLSDEDFKKIAEDSLKRAFNKFRISFWIILLAYVILIGSIIALANSNVNVNPPTPAVTPKQK